jgi:hypothetical protein
MVQIDMANIIQLERDLSKLYRKAVPFAERQAVNTTAFDLQAEARQTVRRTMTLRNRWTERGIQLTKATSRNPEAEVGSLSDYMVKQEFGGTKSKGGKVGTPIATPYSSGEGLKAQPRKKLARRPNQLKNIRLTRTKSGETNVAKIKQAQRSGKKFLYLDFGRSKGIFRILKTRIRMVHDLKQRTVVINPSPWLQPSVRRVLPRMREFYSDALEEQIRRQRLFSQR